MRPLTLTFQAFGPYAGREHIDFEDLTSKGLLLICGDTGSGKTMILDAMTLALYGKASGGLRNEFSSLRCNRCKPEDDTFIEFVFEAGGSVYKFERRLEKKRVNLSEKQQIYKRDEKGNFEPLREKINKSEMPGIARDLIGLDYDQFTQVIILPQGKFEQFLESDSGQKGEILTEIFGAKRWEAAAQNYYDSVKAECDALNDKKNRVNSILSGEGCENLEELSQKIEGTESTLKELEDSFHSADYDTKRTRLLEEKETAGKLEELNKALIKRRKEAKAAETAETKCTEDLEGAEKRLLEHKSKESDKEAWIREKATLEAKRELYANADKVREDFEKAESAWQKAARDAADADHKLEQADRKDKEALVAYEKANRKHQEDLAAFARGAAGRLAADLKEGEACPVCGSIEHPHPAQAAADAVNSEQLEKERITAEHKNEEWKQACEKTGKAKDAAAKAHETLTEHEKAKAAAEKTMQDSQAGMIEGIGSLKELEKRIEGIEKDTAAYDKKLEELTAIESKSKVSLAGAQKARETAEKEAVKAADELETARRKFKESGIEEPDVTIIDAELKIIDEKTADFQRQQGSLQTSIERLSGMHRELTGDWNQYAEQISDAEDALAFARQLRGDTSIGLERYVLGIMFDQVVYAANEMLTKVHGGRYSLVRTEESKTGSRKKGLELAVLDSFSESDGLRSAGSLSGGEKFLVSLALSIGMTTIARTDGINIDAMFIDEGFGSLDENSIGDALEVLESIRGGAESFVGIISHVQILRDSIPSKLIVHKSRSTSTIEYTMG